MQVKSARRALLLLLTGGAAAQGWADVKIEPSVAVSAIYVDNLDLAPPGATKSGDLVGELVPRLQVEQKGPRLTSALDYSAQGLFFRDHSDLNAVYHNGTANASWTGVPNLFFVEGWASYTQQTIDPTEPRNVGNLFNVANIADELNVMVAPYFRRDFGHMTGLLRYAESISNFSGVAGTGAQALLQDSRTGIATARLASDDADAPVAWSLDGRSSHTTFESAEPFRSDRASAEGSMRILQSLRLLGAVGAETDVLQHATTGGLDAAFWLVGFKWAPSPRSALEARAGHRFFGRSYSARWTHESRVLRFQATYTEEPTNDSQTAALTEFVPGEIVVDPQAYAGVLRSNSTFATYLRKQLEAVVELRGRLTQISLRGYRMRREYLDAALLGDSDSTSGGEFILSRDLSARGKLALSARLDNSAQLNGFEYRDHRYAIEYTHKISLTLEVSVQAVHLERSGSTEYRANIGQLTLRKAL